jgi:hypothetical protein
MKASVGARTAHPGSRRFGRSYPIAGGGSMQSAAAVDRTGQTMPVASGDDPG